MGNTTKGVQSEINAAIRKPRVRGFDSKALPLCKQIVFTNFCHLQENDIDLYKSEIHIIRSMANRWKNIQAQNIGIVG